MDTNIKMIDDFKIVMDSVLKIQADNIAIELEVDRLTEMLNILIDHGTDVY